MPESQIGAVLDLTDALEATVNEVKAIGLERDGEPVGCDTRAWMMSETVGRLEDRLSGRQIDSLFGWLEAALETSQIREEAIARVIKRHRNLQQSPESS